jgi:hypothetical protein
MPLSIKDPMLQPLYGFLSEAEQADDNEAEAISRKIDAWFDSLPLQRREEFAFYFEDLIDRIKIKKESK